MSEKKKELIRTIKFVLFSISAGVIQLVSDTIALEVFHEDGWVAYTVGLTLSVLWNFTLNRKFTFQSANNVPVAMLKVAAYYAVFAPISIWWTKVLVDDRGINEYLILVCTMLVNFVTEYVYQRFVVFGKSIDTAENAEKSEA